TAHQFLQVLALDVLEHDELAVAGLPTVDDGDDVRMRQTRDRERLAAEALDVVRVGCVAVVEDLDRDAAAELPVVRAVDVGHPTGAGQLLELVPLRNDLADHSTGKTRTSHEAS